MADLRAPLLFDYRLKERVAVDGTARRHLERWDVSVSAQGEEVGTAHVVLFNLEPGRDIRDLADRVSGTWIDVHGIPAEPAVGPDTHMLLLDRVWVKPAHRGQGLGPIIAAAVIDRLARGCNLAACYPAPFEATPYAVDRDYSIDMLGKVWAKVGFTHWRDGVWMLDLNGHDTYAVLVHLLEERLRRAA